MSGEPFPLFDRPWGEALVIAGLQFDSHQRFDLGTLRAAFEADRVRPGGGRVFGTVGRDCRWTGVGPQSSFDELVIGLGSADDTQSAVDLLLMSGGATRAPAVLFGVGVNAVFVVYNHLLGGATTGIRLLSLALGKPLPRGALLVGDPSNRLADTMLTAIQHPLRSWNALARARNASSSLSVQSRTYPKLSPQVRVLRNPVGADLSTSAVCSSVYSAFTRSGILDKDIPIRMLFRTEVRSRWEGSTGNDLMVVPMALADPADPVQWRECIASYRASELPKLLQAASVVRRSLLGRMGRPPRRGLGEVGINFSIVRHAGDSAISELLDRGQAAAFIRTGSTSQQSVSVRLDSFEKATFMSLTADSKDLVESALEVLRGEYGWIRLGDVA